MGDKDDRLKKATEEELQVAARAEQLRLRAEMRQITSKRRAGKLEEKDQESHKLWSEFSDSATKLSESGQQGYDSWVASMSQIMIMCRKLNLAIASSAPISSLFESAVYDLLIPIGQTYIVDPIEEKLYKRKGPEPIAAQALPRLQVPLSFTDDNKLDLEGFKKYVKRSDGKDVTPKQQALLENGLKCWLDQLEYSEDLPANKNVFKHKNTGVQLDKKRFVELRDDPVKGLESFLNKRFEMKFEHTARP